MRISGWSDSHNCWTCLCPWKHHPWPPSFRQRPQRSARKQTHLRAPHCEISGITACSPIASVRAGISTCGTALPASRFRCDLAKAILKPAWRRSCWRYMRKTHCRFLIPSQKRTWRRRSGCCGSSLKNWPLMTRRRLTGRKRGRRKRTILMSDR